MERGYPEFEISDMPSDAQSADQQINPRYRTSDGVRIRRTRQQLGWTQSELAAKAGVGLRTIQKMEKMESGARSEKANVAAVEQALGIRPQNWALEYLGTLNPGKANVLRSKTAELWPGDVDPYHHFVRALHRDAEGEHSVALRLCRLILEEEGDRSDAPFVCAVSIHMACVYDHLKEPLKALDASEKALIAASGLGEDSKLRWWCVYQKAIAHIGLEQYATAQAILGELVQRAKNGKHRQAAALHQLGVIQLLLREPVKAIDFFEKCVALRRPEEVRLCYEYRRLGEAHAELRHQEKSESYYRDALDIAIRHNFLRYVDIVYSEAARYGITLDRGARSTHGMIPRFREHPGPNSGDER